MASFELRLVPCLQDNYAVIMRDHESGHCAIVDVPEAEPVEAALRENGWKPDMVLLTHKHADHVQGVDAIRRAYGAEVFGPAEVPEGLRERLVQPGGKVEMGNLKGEVIATPGHTLGHVAYHFPSEELLFTGDSLFVMGCGRVFEGSMQEMYDTLMRLARLPKQTRIYCGHEYTLNNARFAASVLPDNAAINERLETIRSLRDMGRHTVPTTIQLELDTNPFLMCAREELRQALKLPDAEPVEVFTRLRQMKDRF